MRELYYSRHGETEDLAAKIRSRPSTELTAAGREQARQAGGLLVACQVLPTLIVCSELPRAIQSAEAMAGVIGYDKGRIMQHPLLNERGWGEAMGVKNTEVKKRWPEGFDTIPGAEIVEALQKRAGEVAGWLRELEEDTVLVVGHGTIGRAIVREFEGRPHTDEYNSERGAFENGQVARLYPLPVEVLAVS
jgi:broad specificity phosphatase PhoE